MNLLVSIITASWDLLLDSSLYIILGLVIAGLLKSYLSASFVARHLGRGRFLPVIKAALLGIPIPLCSCGVIPTAAALKKQGASNGATIAFLVSTPESGIDSISVSYALLDPLLTVARPVAAFISAIFAGMMESLFGPDAGAAKAPSLAVIPPLTDRSTPANGNGSGSAESVGTRIKAASRYVYDELWGDLAPWFALGLLLSGLITVLVPDDLVAGYLGGGPVAMLIMLAVGIPIYICASASTPIAASLILKGVSPGAALVFLLAGPATNMASLSMLTSLLGKRGTLRYLLSLGLSSFLCGLLLDQIYQWSGLSAQAVIGQAGDIVPYYWQLTGALLLIGFSIRPVYRSLTCRLGRLFHGRAKLPSDQGCGCATGNCRD